MNDTRHPPAAASSVHRYGDFPELFWDLEPDAIVDARHPSILARILVRGSMDAIRTLVSFAEVRRQLPDLPMPEHARRFWAVVVDRLPPHVVASSAGSGASA